MSLGDLLTQEMQAEAAPQTAPTIEWSRQLVSIIQYMSRIIANATGLKSAEINEQDAEAWVTALKPLEEELSQGFSTSFKYMPLIVVSLAYVSRILKEWSDKRKSFNLPQSIQLNENKEVGKSRDTGNVGKREDHLNASNTGKTEIQGDRDRPRGEFGNDSTVKSSESEMQGKGQ